MQAPLLILGTFGYRGSTWSDKTQRELTPSLTVALPTRHVKDILRILTLKHARLGLLGNRLQMRTIENAILNLGKRR